MRRCIRSRRQPYPVRRGNAHGYHVPCLFILSFESSDPLYSDPWCAGRWTAADCMPLASLLAAGRAHQWKASVGRKRLGCFLLLFPLCLLLRGLLCSPSSHWAPATFFFPRSFSQRVLLVLGAFPSLLGFLTPCCLFCK